MPLYDYKCEQCHREFEDIRTIAERKVSTCPSCDGVGRQIIKPGRAPGVSTFPTGWYRDIQWEPVYINNPQELRDACDRNCSYSEALENGVWRTSPGPDPEHK